VFMMAEPEQEGKRKGELRRVKHRRPTYPHSCGDEGKLAGQLELTQKSGRADQVRDAGEERKKTTVDNPDTRYPGKS